MKKTGKVFSRIFLSLAMAVLMLSSAMVVFAAGEALSKLEATKTENNATKKVTSVTLYTNGDTAAVEGQAVATPKEIELDVNAILKSTGKSGKYVVTTQNAQVAKVVRKAASPDLITGSTDFDPKSDYYKIKITAGNTNGKTKVILSAPDLGKKFTINVTVKTLVDKFDFGNNVKKTEKVLPDGTTKVEYKVEIAKGGKLTLNASPNGNASVKKVGYELLYMDRQFNADGTPNTNKSGKNAIATVSNGKITGVNPGHTEIRVYAKDQKVKSSSGTKAVDSGNSVTVVVEVKDAAAASAKILYPELVNKKYVMNLKTNEGSADHTGRIVAEVYDKAGQRTGVTYSSSKPAVASVDSNGKVTALKNGTATITVSPAEGTALKSNAKPKTITVKVTTDLEKIDIPNDYITVVEKKTVSLGAKVDKNVTKKNLSYDTLDDESAKYIKVKNGKITGLAATPVKDGKDVYATFTVRGVAANANDKANTEVCRTIYVKVVSKDAPSLALKKVTQEDLSSRLNSVRTEYKAGEKVDLKALLLADGYLKDKGTAPKAVALAYKTSDKTVATVSNGVVTFNKKIKAGESKSVAITVYVKKGTAQDAATDESITYTLPAFTVTGNADTKWITDLDKKIKFAATSNDYSWTSMKVTFNAAYRLLNAQIQEGSISADGSEVSMYNDLVNLFSFFDDLGTMQADITKLEARVSDAKGTGKAVKYTATHKSGKIVLSKDGETFGEYNTLQDRTALKALAEKMTEGCDKGSDWYGKTIDITLYRGDDAVTYRVAFKGNAKDIDTLIDSRINANISKIDLTKAPELGAITYNGANNTVCVSYIDGDADIAATAEKIKKDTKDALLAIFADAEKVEIEIQGAGLKEAERKWTDVKGTKDLDSAIDKLYDKVSNKLVSASDLAKLTSLEGAVIVSKVTFKYEDIAVDYKVIFKQDMTVVDQRKDDEILEDIATVDTEKKVFGSIDYDKDTNTFTLGIKELGDVSIKNVANTGILGTIQKLANSNGVTNLKVITKGQKDDKPVDLKPGFTRDELEAAVLTTETKPSELIDKVIYVEATYGANAKNKIMYTFVFTIDTSGIETEVAKDMNKYADEINSNPGIIQHIDVKDDTITTFFDDKKKDDAIEALKGKGLYGILETAFKLEDKVNHVKAKGVQLEAKNGSKTFDKLPTDLEIADALELYAGVKKIGDLDGQELVINVTYETSAGVKVVTYKVNFVLIPTEEPKSTVAEDDVEADTDVEDTNTDVEDTEADVEDTEDAETVEDSSEEAEEVQEANEEPAETVDEEVSEAEVAEEEVLD